MKNKILIQLIVPDIDECYDLFIPVNMRIGEVIVLIEKIITELTNGMYISGQNKTFYNCLNSEKYKLNDLVRKTDIRNGTKLLLA